jgi:hypothetical protein
MKQLDQHHQPRLHVVLSDMGLLAAFTDHDEAVTQATHLREDQRAKHVRIVEYVAVRIRDT